MKLPCSVDVDLGAGDPSEGHQRALVDAHSGEQLALAQSARLRAGGQVRRPGNGRPHAHLGGRGGTVEVVGEAAERSL